MSEYFDSLLGPTYKAPTVPAPDTATISPTPIFDSLSEAPKPAAPSTETPIFNELSGVKNQPSSVTPIFDELTRSGAPTGSPLKLGDILFPPSPPAPPPPPAPPSRGWIPDVASSIARGLAVRLPGQIGQAIKYYSTTPMGMVPTGWGTFSTPGEQTGEPGFFQQLGDAMTKWEEEAPKRYPFLAASKEEADSFLRRGVTGIFKNAPPSLTPVLVGAILGSTAFPIIGPLGPVAGGLLGAGLSTMATFGASAYNEAYEKALKIGKSKEESGNIAGKIGWIEGGIEALTDPIEMATMGFGRFGTQPLKQTIRSMLRPSLRKTLKESLLKVAPIETGTEMLQDYWEAAIQKEAGMETPEPWTAAKEAILPSIGMSILFGAGTHALNKKVRNQILNSLTNENASLGDRIQAVQVVQNEINRMSPPDDKELATLWGTKAMDDIMAGKKIDIDADFVNYILPPEVSAPQPTPAGPVVPTPSVSAPTITPTPEAVTPAPSAQPQPVPPHRRQRPRPPRHFRGWSLQPKPIRTYSISWLEELAENRPRFRRLSRIPP